MGRMSVKENKNVYLKRREELGLSREKASELLGAITPDHLEKIENEKIAIPDPEDVLLMADKYREPGLCNYYCANQCPIGERYVPEIKMKDLASLVLDMLDSLNSIEEQKNRLIEIAHDGEITRDEIRDFAMIQKKLERISMIVDGLNLWSESMVANGAIDEKEYKQYMKEE
jgi:transcriptional regulator with XRE-family HTH domain